MKKDKLHSRRDFFKIAKKKVLPIIGLTMMINVPGIVNASKTPMDCAYGCAASCYGGCFTACSNNACRTNCQHTCSGGCDRTCQGTCSGTCYGTCERGNMY